MFPRILQDLTPGAVALSYIKGNRVRYVGPVGYFFLVLTMFLLVMELLNVDFYTLSKASAFNFDSEKQQTFQKVFTDLIARYVRTFSFIQYL
jgi:hypothetical protein